MEMWMWRTRPYFNLRSERAFPFPLRFRPFPFSRLSDFRGENGRRSGGVGDPFLLLATLEGSSLFFFFSILDPDMPAKGGRKRKRKSPLGGERERGMMIFLLLPFSGKNTFRVGKEVSFQQHALATCIRWSVYCIQTDGWRNLHAGGGGGRGKGSLILWKLKGENRQTKPLKPPPPPPS